MQITQEELLLEAAQMALEIRLLKKRIEVLEAQVVSLSIKDKKDD